jgi:hypothetical protein
MAQKHEIHYSHPGLQPPVFIAGSMCKPQWEPIEMEHTEKEDGELDFKHEFEADAGEYQYKFRLGPGDWWVLDESKPTGKHKPIFRWSKALLTSASKSTTEQAFATIFSSWSPSPWNQ